MKLFEVTNGFVGYSHVRCLVVAVSESDALTLARERFHAEGMTQGQTATYWERLTATVLCEDLTQSWAGIVSD